MSDYFANEEGLIETFDFDYDLLNGFDTSLELRSSLLIFCSLPCYFACERDNIIDRNNAQHVCVTHDGIRYSVDRHKAGLRCDCAMAGRTTKTVPFDKITDCDIEEAAGASGPVCCMVDNVISSVNVDTASSEGGVHEVVLRGLKDPHGFKKLVWKVKREVCSVVGGDVAPVSDDMSRHVELLERQTDLLREQRDILRTIAGAGVVVDDVKISGED
mmetsp:Transcript_21373/g.34809  ORF Transcript_21373/g.34809 Transcript_21373/m.34809 type:complete len:216 (-) Transcript_21373:110-757(-)|eukprot:CAMPEP_0203752460 /NCGR_PEP_ID=MMETSP0098-20131031/6386_1 /ASSEMBLY_ACC=CAM_ASM_000208 /TAXON_ID=96639 /ORGANISM=" , Strain NY0313808BC1" /LENGTH=215 /DNA_ID=CAMNT_0050642639 /DNA_START=57 /DNA_END=704 /DNA_ORIENTATION=+